MHFEKTFANVGQKMTKKKKKACNKYNFRVINEIIMPYNIMTSNVLFISGNMIFRDLTHVMIVKWAKSNKNPIADFCKLSDNAQNAAETFTIKSGFSQYGSSS